jgi:cell wall-associated NlpC family hydrolase
MLDEFKISEYTRRKMAVEYAEKFIGKFYKWGGDDPAGFDYSGLAIEVLKAVGVLPRKGD